MTRNVVRVEVLENYDRQLQDWEEPLGGAHGGVKTETLKRLLDKVGQDGDNPTIVGYLYELAVENPPITAYALYPDPMDAVYDIAEEPHDTYPTLFGVYQQRSVRPRSEPVGLVLVEASDYTIHKGFRVARIVSWFNRSITSQGLEVEEQLRQQAYKEIFTDCSYGFGVCVRPDVAIYDTALSNGHIARSLTDVGVSPDDHVSGAKSQQMSRLVNIESRQFGEKSQLIQALSNIFTRLDPDVIGIDMEGGEHYSFALNGANSTELGDIDGITIGIEDRPGGSMFSMDDEREYSNPWGDMVVTISLCKETVQTKYILTVFMDKDYGYSTSYLDKRTVPRRENGNALQHMVGNLIDLQEDDLDITTDLNRIDKIELGSLTRLLEKASQL